MKTLTFTRASEATHVQREVWFTMGPHVPRFDGECDCGICQLDEFPTQHIPTQIGYGGETVELEFAGKFMAARMIFDKDDPLIGIPVLAIRGDMIIDSTGLTWKKGDTVLIDLEKGEATVIPKGEGDKEGPPRLTLHVEVAPPKERKDEG